MGKITFCETYIGLDSEEQEICRYTAIDADKDINPLEIEESVQKIINKLNDIIYSNEGFISKLDQLKDYTYSSIIITDFNYDKDIEEIKAKAKLTILNIIESMEDLIKQSEEAHSTLQTQYNSEALTSANSYAGVVSTRKVG